MEADRLKENYIQLSTDLLEWIQHKLLQLDDRQFPNTIEGIQGQLLDFKQYRTVEKPPKSVQSDQHLIRSDAQTKHLIGYLRYKERSEIEALFFATNTQLATLRQPSFIPPEGVSLYALQKAWDALEKAEHRREVALRNELLRLERLEQLAYKFERKVIISHHVSDLYATSQHTHRFLLLSCHSLGFAERWLPQRNDSSSLRPTLR